MLACYFNLLLVNEHMNSDILIPEEIIESCKNGDLNGVDQWINIEGIDINNTDKYGRTLACYATMYQHEHIVHLLIEHKADFTRKDMFSNDAYFYEKHHESGKKRAEIEMELLRAELE